jgi:hypothetical protein
VSLTTGTEIPQQLEALTPLWLTDALREQGQLAAGRVGRVGIEPLGEGGGFIGVVARLHLGYEGDAGAAPATLIAKLPSQIGMNRMAGELLGAYWREIHFYRELTDEVPIRTPRHYYSSLAPDPMRPRLDKILRVVDRMPGWFVDPVMARSKEILGRSPHRYLLLIEDLAPARPGDQLGGGTPEVCAAVLTAVAKMHAGFWRSPTLDRHFWLNDPTVTLRIRHRMYQESRPSFLERHQKRLGEFGLALVEWHDRNGLRLQRRLYRQAPPTLVHGDLRLDNLFFDDSSAGDQVLLADWQLMGRGPAAHDVAYFLSGALDGDASAMTEEALLRHYHAELVKGGVDDYPVDRLLRDYGAGLLAMLQLHGTADTVDVGEGRGGELMDRWLDRTLARLRNVDLDELA